MHPIPGNSQENIPKVSSGYNGFVLDFFIFFCQIFCLIGYHKFVKMNFINIQLEKGIHIPDLANDLFIGLFGCAASYGSMKQMSYVSRIAIFVVLVVLLMLLFEVSLTFYYV